MSRIFTRAKVATVASMAAALVLAGCGASADDTKTNTDGGGEGKDTLILASVPSEEAGNLQAQFDSLITVIEKETGKKVEFQEATDYAAVIEGQRAGKIDLASYGPFSYKIAKDGGINIEPIGAMVDGEDEEPGYTSMLWVKKDSDIQKIEDLKGKTVCFVDKASTSGYLYPSAGLLEAGLDPAKDVKEVMAGGHDASLLAVNSGQCDAGFAFDAMIDKVAESGQINKDEFRMVWESEQIMGSPLAMNNDTIDEETQEVLRSVLIEKGNVDAMTEAGVCESPESCKLPEDSWGFKKVTDADYDGVRKVCELTKAEACNG
ncbi:phosphate/phosphite/phosphonate ABC transporter substrate-binding protein [Enemella sp. A6]|uniref:phosphate/phosphite/phosphonate ABC transporter substrate-binding protein n=1 Tax=Enemella sp. A6 TaxID=3440152 RepID=UPI003EBEA0F5